MVRFLVRRRCITDAVPKYGTCAADASDVSVLVGGPGIRDYTCQRLETLPTYNDASPLERRVARDGRCGSARHYYRPPPSLKCSDRPWIRSSASHCINSDLPPEPVIYIKCCLLPSTRLICTIARSSLINSINRGPFSSLYNTRVSVSLSYPRTDARGQEKKVRAVEIKLNIQET